MIDVINEQGDTETVPCTPDALAKAASRGFYADCDTQKPSRCIDCGRPFRGVGRLCDPCFVMVKL